MAFNFNIFFYFCGSFEVLFSEENAPLFRGFPGFIFQGENNSKKTSENALLFSWNSPQVICTLAYAKYHDPSSSGSSDILFTGFHRFTIAKFEIRDITLE